MKQYTFEKKHRSVWKQLEDMLLLLEKKSDKTDKSSKLSEFPKLYRQVCYHYAMAKTQQYSPKLIEWLHGLVMRAHQQLYRSKLLLLWHVLQFILADFPVMVRKNASLFWLSTALLFVPAIILGVMCFYNADFIYTVLSEQDVLGYEAMYNPAAKVIGRSRESATDFMMFGYYIQHNIGIGFRTFAGGLILGLGTVTSLLFNGISIGAISGYLTQLGYNETFWSFVSGHSSFELTAICISGAAGLRLAYALFAPGRMRRLEALRHASKEAIVLVIGAAIMLVGAAFLEAFWSSNRMIPLQIKYTVAAVLWIFIISYLSLAGRRYEY